ncbi:hypothetical protein AWZ03_011122 [Drosophila navojoa]|uniref:Uncharacterized protein n=1 Tax=Drosophila navojoa TaxID=7232 RepID=A0A484B163_DRONA|nr:hypothetical protein AWZ03_011122 [Drosophila navojoa]
MEPGTVTPPHASPRLTSPHGHVAYWPPHLRHLPRDLVKLQCFAEPRTDPDNNGCVSDFYVWHWLRCQTERRALQQQQQQQQQQQH